MPQLIPMLPASGGDTPVMSGNGKGAASEPFSPQLQKAVDSARRKDSNSSPPQKTQGPAKAGDIKDQNTHSSISESVKDTATNSENSNTAENKESVNADNSAGNEAAAPQTATTTEGNGQKATASGIDANSGSALMGEAKAQLLGEQGPVATIRQQTQATKQATVLLAGGKNAATEQGAATSRRQGTAASNQAAASPASLGQDLRPATELQQDQSMALAQTTTLGDSKQSQTGSQQNPLLSEIEKILQARPAGEKVVITATTTAATAAKADPATLSKMADQAPEPILTPGNRVTLVNSQDPALQSSALPAAQNDSRGASLRQTQQQQLLDADNAAVATKLASAAEKQVVGADEGVQSQLQGQNNQGMGSQSSQTSTSADPQTGIFSVAAKAGSSQTPLAAANPTTVQLPSGNTVYENEVVNQFIDKFQLTNRQFESRVNLKLHPAELGELQIEMTLKDGSIKASVVAQSAVVQDIVERNLAKLRTILEDQGLKVEQIAVTTDNDTVADFSFLNQQFHNQDHQSGSPSGSSYKSAAFLPADEPAAVEYAPEGGVNVTV